MTPKGQKELSVEERKLILRLREQNKSYGEIAKIANRSRQTIQTTLRRYSNSVNVRSRSRSGRPKILSVRDERRIIKLVKENPKLTSPAITKQLSLANEINVSPRTVRRAINNVGYHCRVARRKPLISTANQTKRMEFAKTYLSKDMEFWAKVLWSDESKFNIFQSDGRELVWRRVNTELQSSNLQKTVKHGGGGVLVWGSMAASGVGELVFIEQIMDKHIYLNILKNNLQKSAEKLGLGVSFYFQQDNDPKHTAHIVKQWLIYNVPHLLNTPPQSPDLNPIEHVWMELKRRLKKHNITSKQELKEKLIEEWNKITPAFTNKLVSSMHRRLQEVIKYKGLATKY